MDEDAFRELVSGSRSGLVPTLLRASLAGLSWAYGAAVHIRQSSYDRGWKKIHRAPVPVVSVGNITAGGTGKTPFVAYLAEWFRRRDVPVALLSRGYRALPGEVNDEKLLLDRLCPGVPHLQHPDRVRSARLAVENHAARVLILDDGFQHRRLHRDLDIVLVDALHPWGYGHLLPRGLLREPVGSLRRADLIVLTRADQCPHDEKQRMIERLAELRGSGEHVEVAFPPACLVNRAGDTAEIDSLRGAQVAAFCGIGNPDGFERLLTRAGLEIAAFHRFPDHHHYSTTDLERLGEQAQQVRAAAVLTTEKDIVKIEPAELGGWPLWAVRIGTQILEGGALLEERLERIAAANAQR